MWDAIEANKRRSTIILLFMLVLLLAMGAALGTYIDPARGPLVGPLAALGLWAFLSLLAYFQGDSILLATAGAREIQKSDAPQVWNIVEEMTIAAGLTVMPRVFLIYDDAPNAFATGRKPEKSAVAVTTGLLQRLDRDELQGVIAHEIGHVRNLDVRYMTIAAVMLGAIVMMADVALRSMRFGGGGRGGRRKGQEQLVIFVVMIALAILAPLLARALYFACSRRREFLADASAALFTRYPEGLARALEKIALNPIKPQQFNRAVAPLYIINPLQAFGATGLFSTHPSTEDRIRILRTMAGGADLASYDEAYRAARGAKRPLFKQALIDEQMKLRVPQRELSPAAAKVEDRIQRAASALDTIDRLVGYSVLPCECGVKIKTPQGFPSGVIRCPRCGREHIIRREPLKPPPVAPVNWSE